MYNVLITGTWEVPVEADNVTEAEALARHMVVSGETALIGPGTFHMQAFAGPAFESSAADS